jgi:hypothetical protein
VANSYLPGGETLTTRDVFFLRAGASIAVAEQYRDALWLESSLTDLSEHNRGEMKMMVREATAPSNINYRKALSIVERAEDNPIIEFYRSILEVLQVQRDEKESPIIYYVYVRTDTYRFIEQFYERELQFKLDNPHLQFHTNCIRVLPGEPVDSTLGDGSIIYKREEDARYDSPS